MSEEDADLRPQDVQGFSAAVSESTFEDLRESRNVTVTDWTGMGSMSEFDVFLSLSLPSDPVTECYNPNCEELVRWQRNIHEAYCSEGCAVEAREGQA